MDINLNEMSITELKELKSDVTSTLKERNEEVKAEAKAKKEADKAKAFEAGKAIAEIDAVVSFDYKGTPSTGRIIKIAEKTVTVILVDEDGEDIMNDKGKPSKTWRYFNQIH